MQYNYCPNCGKQVPSAVVKCGQCGQFLGVQDRTGEVEKTETQKWAEGCVWAMVFFVVILIGFGQLKNALGSSGHTFNDQYPSAEATHGKRPECSAWDGAPYIARDYLKKTLRDPGSLADENWSECSPVEYKGMNCWKVRVTYRAKNGFGGYARESMTFFMRNENVIWTEN